MQIKFLPLVISIMFPVLTLASEGTGLGFETTSSLSAENLRTGLEVREHKKVGLGASLAGSGGLWAANIELNIEADDSGVAQIGGGRGYDAVSFLWKHYFSDGNLLPYSTAGYSRWFNLKQEVGASSYTNPILSGFLTENEKKSGKFALDLFVAGFGGQYFETDEDLLGVSYFAEILLMYSFGDKKAVPTAGLGMSYLF